MPLGAKTNFHEKYNALGLFSRACFFSLIGALWRPRSAYIAARARDRSGTDQQALPAGGNSG